MHRSAAKPTLDQVSIFSPQTPDRISDNSKCAAHVSSNHMKSLIVCLLIAISACGASSATIVPVTVQFTNPAKFTDFQIRGRDANYTAGVFASDVTAELTPVMKQKYPNASLVLLFTDIDLAGRYAGGPRPSWSGRPSATSSSSPQSRRRRRPGSLQQ